MVKIPTKYIKPPWAVNQIIRENGMIEDICEHGIGHPNHVWYQERVKKHGTSIGIHGCCGCCLKKEEVT